MTGLVTSEQAHGKGGPFSAMSHHVRRRVYGCTRGVWKSRGAAREPGKDQEMPRLPIAVSKHLGWRANLPPLQVHCTLAELCAGMMSASFKRPGEPFRLLSPPGPRGINGSLNTNRQEACRLRWPCLCCGRYGNSVASMLECYA